MRRCWCAVAVLLVGVGCGSGSLERAALDDAEQRWAAAGIDTYWLSYEGTFADRFEWRRVIVDGGAIEEGSGPDAPTVAELFSLLGDAIDEGESVAADFDGVTGLPLAVDGIDLDIEMKEFIVLERPDACEIGTGGPLDLVAEPAHRLRHSQGRFIDTDACPVRLDVVMTFPGAAHCGWESVEYLVIGGVPDQTYLWDPDQQLSAYDRVDRAQLVSLDDIDRLDLVDTGWVQGGERLLVDTAAEFAYLVGEQGARRYVRDADRFFLCD